MKILMTPIDRVEAEQLRKGLPAFKPGDTVRVHVRVVEGGKERIQVFESTVLGRSGGGSRETFTVRKVSYGVGVERIFPVHSPRIDRIEVVTRGAVRRAKLYYLRSRSAAAECASGFRPAVRCATRSSRGATCRPARGRSSSAAPSSRSSIRSAAARPRARSSSPTA